MVFLGCLFDRSREKEYLQNSRAGLSNAANTFQWNLLEGFYKNGKDVKIINALPVGTFPKQYKKLFLNSGSWGENGNNQEVGCINLPFIKQHQRYLKTKKLLKNSKDKDIIIYSAYEPFLKAAFELDKSYNITVVITDLPEFYDLGKTSKLKSILRKINNKRIEKYLTRVDKFVLLTEQMAEPLKVGNRPYTVVEGIANGEPGMVSNASSKSILYTGTLHRQFGILTLLKAFSLVDDPEAELWICGGGDSKAEVEAAAEKDSRIKFYGYVSKDAVAKLQQKAAVLINPRPDEGEYTKYSFPSKTMEYMLSGKPVLMYKLSGIPAEYDPYLHYIEGNSAEDMKNAICKLFESDAALLKTQSQAAARFVAENKSSAVQAKRIIDFIE